MVASYEQILTKQKAMKKEFQAGQNYQGIADTFGSYGRDVQKSKKIKEELETEIGV